MRIQSRRNRHSRRDADRSIHKIVVNRDTLPRKPVQLGRAGVWAAQKAEGSTARLVSDQQDQIQWPIGWLRADGQRRGGTEETSHHGAPSRCVVVFWHG